MRQSQPIKFSGVVEFAPDGRFIGRVFVEGAQLRRLGVAHACGRIDENANRATANLPNTKRSAKWAAIADNDDLLEDALIYFGRVSAPDPGQHPPTFWFDIYKALECLMNRSGGEADFLALDWAPRKEVGATQTDRGLVKARPAEKTGAPAPTTEQQAKELDETLAATGIETAGTP